MVCYAALHDLCRPPKIVRTRVSKKSLSETSRFPGWLVVFGLTSMVMLNNGSS